MQLHSIFTIAVWSGIYLCSNVFLKISGYLQPSFVAEVPARRVENTPHSSPYFLNNTSTTYLPSNLDTILIISRLKYLWWILSFDPPATHPICLELYNSTTAEGHKSKTCRWTDKCPGWQRDSSEGSSVLKNGPFCSQTGPCWVLNWYDVKGLSPIACCLVVQGYRAPVCVTSELGGDWGICMYSDVRVHFPAPVNLNPFLVDTKATETFTFSFQGHCSQ